MNGTGDPINVALDENEALRVDAEWAQQRADEAQEERDATYADLEELVTNLAEVLSVPAVLLTDDEDDPGVLNSEGVLQAVRDLCAAKAGRL